MFEHFQDTNNTGFYQMATLRWRSTSFEPSVRYWPSKAPDLTYNDLSLMLSVALCSDEKKRREQAIINKLQPEVSSSRATEWWLQDRNSRSSVYVVYASFLTAENEITARFSAAYHILPSIENSWWTTCYWTIWTLQLYCTSLVSSRWWDEWIGFRSCCLPMLMQVQTTRVSTGCVDVALHLIIVCSFRRCLLSSAVHHDFVWLLSLAIHWNVSLQNRLDLSHPINVRWCLWMSLVWFIRIYSSLCGTSSLGWSSTATLIQPSRWNHSLTELDKHWLSFLSSSRMVNSMIFLDS